MKFQDLFFNQHIYIKVNFRQYHSKEFILSIVNIILEAIFYQIVFVNDFFETYYFQILYCVNRSETLFIESVLSILSSFNISKLSHCSI